MKVTQRQRLQEEADSLKKRMDVGLKQIEAAKDVGVDTEKWEEFWVALARQYADICDELMGGDNGNA